MVSWKAFISFLFVFHHGRARALDFQSDLINVDKSWTFTEAQSFDDTFDLRKIITDPVGATLRIEAEVGRDANVTCPIIFIVQQGETVQSFHLPQNISYDGKTSFLHFSAGRTICFNPYNTQINETIQKVRVTVSTCGKTGVQYRYKLRGSSNSYIQKDTLMNVTSVSPTSPAYFPYKFQSKRGKDIVLVEVRSPDNICMTVSIQSPQCPVADQEDTVNFKGKRRNYWQTMTTVSLMPITRNDFPMGFELVFVVNTNDARCKEYRGLNPTASEYSNKTFETQTWDPKLKNITFIINEELPHGEYIYPVFIPIAFYIALMGMVLFLFTIFYQCTIFCMKRRRPEPPNYRVEFSNATLNPATLAEDALSVISRPSIDSTSSSNESHFSPTPIESDQIRILRSRYNPDNSRVNGAGHPPCVTDLVYAPSKHVETSRRYYWLMFTIAIFYSVPVFQLLATYEEILLRTGDNDLCYYNYRCAHPLWKLVDFNHIYSNVGYILLGTFFIFLVYFKERLHQQIIDNLRLAHLSNLEQDPSSSSSPVVHQSLERYGAIQNYGIYYSLGFALIMEGVLSAGYHVCPNRSNFQFDTSFMYVMAVLYMVKIYQFRHPVRINATTTFAILAVIAVISVLGLLVAKWTVSIIFAIVHIFAVFYIQIYMYYIGYITEDGALVTEQTKLMKIVIAKWKRMYLQEHFITWLRPSHPSRILLPILSLPFNIGVMIMHFVIKNDFASHLLYIFIGNLLLYLTYYIVMKMVHLEFIHAKSIQPLIYIPLTIVLWVYALQYFNMNLTSWEKSPSESRQQNEECFLMEFYDFHDMWHFLSAGALFCSFMMLLTLEDALAEIPQRKIPVF